MGQRGNKRFILTLHADVIIGEKTYKGVIGNVSEEGISSTITTFIKTDEEFQPHKGIRLDFQLPSGVEVKLNCEIRWFLKTPDKNTGLILGLFILEPPQVYKDWINQFK
jgi:hypothetical protein